METLEKGFEMQYYLPGDYLVDQKGDFFLLYDWEGHNWIIVNKSGLEIIERIKSGMNLKEITSDLQQHYHLPLEETEKKSRSFIQYLLDSKFLRNHPGNMPNCKVSEDKQPLSNYSCSIIFRDCNLDCVYCYNKRIRNLNQPDYREMTSLEFKSALKQLVDFGVKRLMFSGGEPTLRKDLLQLAEYVKSLDSSIKIALVTNGTQITEVNAGTISHLFDLVWISLDSYNKDEHEALRGTGTYLKTINGIRLLVANNANTLVNSMISDFNYKSIEKTKSYVLNELGVRRFRMSIYQPYETGKMNLPNGLKLNVPPFVSTFMTENSDTPLISFIDINENSNIESILEETDIIRKRKHCGVARGEFSLHDNGDVYPCQNMCDPSFACGNILRENIKDIYENSYIMRFLRGITVNHIETCKNCPVRYICCGGCRASAYEIYGKTNAYLDIFCSYNKRKALDRLWRNKLIPFQSIHSLKEKISRVDDTKSGYNHS